MWPHIEVLKPLTSGLVTEVFLRIIILLFVLLTQLFVKPHVRHVTKEQLIKYHKNPRMDSLTPPWAVVCVVIVFPLAAFFIPFLLTRNHAEYCQTFLAWTLALSITSIITETLKVTTGRLRPDFLYRCFPDGEVREGLQCTGKPSEVNEGRKSFPSGHSSFSFCSMGFVSLWMCGQLEVFSEKRGKTARAVACLIPLAMAAVVAISRVYDNHHHWGDIFAGSFMGFAVSCGCYARYFSSRSALAKSGPGNICEQCECCSGIIHIQSSTSALTKITY